jgi:hypothetical protein
MSTFIWKKDMTPITIMSKAMTAMVRGRLRATWTSHIISVKRR